MRANEYGDGHHQVAGQGGQRRADDAQDGDQQQVDRHVDQGAGAGDVGKIFCLFFDVQSGLEVDVDAVEQVGQQDDRHHDQPGQEMFFDERAAGPDPEPGQVFDKKGYDDPQQARRQHEQAHHLGENFPGVFLPGVIEKKRLPGVLEHRYDQHHENAELVACLIKAERVGVGHGQYHRPVDDLDHGRGQAGRQVGEPEVQHLFQLNAVDADPQPFEDFRREQEQGNGGSSQVGGKNGLDAPMELQEEQQVEPEVDQDVGQFQSGEFPGFPLQAEVGEGNEGQGIEEQDQDDVIDQTRVTGRDGHQLAEGKAQQQEQGGQNQGRQADENIGRGKYFFLLHRSGQRTVLHEGRVHAVYIEDVQEGQVGVDVGVDAHVGAGDEMGVEGDEQEIEEAADDGRDAVYRRILAQLFDFFNHLYLNSFSSFAAIGFPCPILPETRINSTILLRDNPDEEILILIYCIAIIEPIL